MNKATYFAPEMDVVLFNEADIIRTSGNGIDTPEDEF